MKKTLQVGITGGIGAGKSTVSRIFQSLGIPVYDADSQARMLMTHDASLIEKIKKEFGEQAYQDKGVLNRVYLGQKVFNDEAKLKRLNDLVHPAVANDYIQWSTEKKSYPYVLREAALLFETGSCKTLDKIIVVHAPEELRIARVLTRDPQRDEQKVKDIIRNQMPEAEKLKRADYVITNDETQLVIPQVLELHRKFADALESTKYEIRGTK